MLSAEFAHSMMIVDIIESLCTQNLHLLLDHKCLAWLSDS